MLLFFSRHVEKKTLNCEFPKEVAPVRRGVKLILALSFDWREKPFPCRSQRGFPGQHAVTCVHVIQEIAPPWMERGFISLRYVIEEMKSCWTSGLLVLPQVCFEVCTSSAKPRKQGTTDLWTTIAGLPTVPDRVIRIFHFLYYDFTVPLIWTKYGKLLIVIYNA